MPHVEWTIFAQQPITAWNMERANRLKDRAAAERIFHKFLKGYGRPKPTTLAKSNCAKQTQILLQRIRTRRLSRPKTPCNYRPAVWKNEPNPEIPFSYPP